jgi:hypothetical protein
MCNFQIPVLAQNWLMDLALVALAGEKMEEGPREGEEFRFVVSGAQSYPWRQDKLKKESVLPGHQSGTI